MKNKTWRHHRGTLHAFAVGHGKISCLKLESVNLIGWNRSRDRGTFCHVPRQMRAMSHGDDVKVCFSSIEIFEREKLITYTSNDGKTHFILCLLAQLRQTIPAALEVLWHLWVFNSGSYLNVESRNTLYFEYDRAQHVVGCGPVAQWIPRRPVAPAIWVQFPACHIFFLFSIPDLWF